MSMAVHPLTSGANSQVIDRKLVIYGLEVTDPEVVAGAERFASSNGEDDVTGYVVAALELGAKALSLAGSSVDVNEIRRSVDQFAIRLAESTERSVAAVTEVVTQVGGEEEGSLLRGVEGILDNLKIGLEELLAGEDGPVRASITKTVTATTDSALAEVQRVLAAHQQVINDAMSSDNPGSPLNTLRVELLRAQAEQAGSVHDRLRDIEALLEVSAAVKKTIDSTALKGGTYEQSALSHLDVVCKGIGDILELTGNVPGLNGRSKKGDGVAHIGHPAAAGLEIRVVVEAKDQALSHAAWRRELEEARKNRGATAALGLVRSTDLVTNGDRLRVLDPLNYVLVFDPDVDDHELLLASYQLLRMQAVCAISEDAGDLDLSAIHRAISHGLEMLKEFDKIARATKQTMTNMTTITTTTEKLRDDLRRCLQRVLDLLDASNSDSVHAGE
jgi:hypothetical protein